MSFNRLKLHRSFDFTSIILCSRSLSFDFLNLLLPDISFPVGGTYYLCSEWEYKWGQPIMYLAQITKLLDKIEKLYSDTSFAKCSLIVSGFIVHGFPYQLLSVDVLPFSIFSIFCCQIYYSWITVYTTNVDINSPHHTYIFWH